MSSARLWRSKHFAPILLACLVTNSLIACGAQEEEKRQLPDLVFQPLRPSGDVRLSEQKGRPALIYFWATWCGPCKTLGPALDELFERYGKQVSFYAVAQDSRETVQSFEAKEPHKMPVFLDQDNASAMAIGVSGLPSVVIIDGERNVKYATVGMTSTTKSEIDNILYSLVPSQSHP